MKLLSFFKIVLMFLSDLLCVQHASDKDRFFNGNFSNKAAVDLIIFDIPEGLPVPTVSSPPDSIPQWNKFSEDGLQAVFDFADNYLPDSGALLVMYPFSRDIKSYLLGCCEAFGFKSQCDWWGMNRLHLTLPSNTSSTVSRAINIMIMIGL
jgi:hypothetical protein